MFNILYSVWSIFIYFNAGNLLSRYGFQGMKNPAHRKFCKATKLNVWTRMATLTKLKAFETWKVLDSVKLSHQPPSRPRGDLKNYNRVLYLLICFFQNQTAHSPGVITLKVSSRPITNRLVNTFLENQRRWKLDGSCTTSVLPDIVGKEQNVEYCFQLRCYYR